MTDAITPAPADSPDPVPPTGIREIDVPLMAHVTTAYPQAKFLGVIALETTGAVQAAAPRQFPVRQMTHRDIVDLFASLVRAGHIQQKSILANGQHVWIPMQGSLRYVAVAGSPVAGPKAGPDKAPLIVAP